LAKVGLAGEFDPCLCALGVNQVTGQGASHACVQRRDFSEDGQGREHQME
jgi:hypothetical protein